MSPPPQSCEVFDVVFYFFYFAKMTFLIFFDMYVAVLGIFSQYFVIFSQYLVNSWLVFDQYSALSTHTPLSCMSKELL